MEGDTEFGGLPNPAGARPKKYEFEAMQKDQKHSDDIENLKWLLEVVEDAGSGGIEAPEITRKALLDRDLKPEETRHLLNDLSQGSYNARDANSPILEVRRVSLKYVSRDHP